MFSKTAVVVATGAILGTKGVTKSLARQMFFLGVPKVYRLPFTIMAASWDDVEDKTKAQIALKIEKISRKIISTKGCATTGIKIKYLFSMLRSFHKNNDLALFAADKKYWIDKKWLDKEKPWKNKK